MDIESWIRVRNIVKGFKVAIDLEEAAAAEDFLQDFLKHCEPVRVV